MTPDTTRLKSAVWDLLGLLLRGPPWWAIPVVFVLAVVIYLVDVP